MLFIKPCKGNITSHFNLKRLHPITKKISPHTGLDIGSASDNRIFAGADGEVIRARNIGGYGNVIYLKHKDGYETRYAHLKSFQVVEGQKVKQGDVIAMKGSTGNSTGVHLHFEVRKNGVAVNPVAYINDPSIPLRRGIVGPRVAALQKILNDDGYKLAVDRSFGPATETAVKNFQGKNKLVVDGIVGPATFKALEKVKPSKPKANLKIDGLWGPATTRALQRYFNTIVDGVISGQPKNASTLNISSASFGTGGSQLIRAMQKYYGTVEDGTISHPSLLIRTMQRKYGTIADGTISKLSPLVKELQRRLNSGNL